MQIVWMIQEEWTIINLSLFFPRLVIIGVWRFATEFIRRVSSTNGRSSKSLEFLWSPELFENFKFETSIHTGIYKERYTLCKFMRSIGGTLIRGNFISIHDGGSLMESCNWKLFFNGSKCIPLLIGRRAKRKLIPFFFFSIPFPQILSRQFVGSLSRSQRNPAKLIPFRLRFIENKYGLPISDLNFSFKRAIYSINSIFRINMKSVNYI